jgi:hypothetical protein
MAVQLVDGFDVYNGVGANTGMQSKWTVTNTSASWAMSSGRFGGQAAALTITTAERSFRRTLASGTSSITVGFAFQTPAAFVAGNTLNFLHLKSGSTYMIGLQLNGDTGAVSILLSTSVSAGSAIATSSAGAMTTSTWYYCELSITVSDTVGVANLKINGATVVSASSVDTRNGTPTTIDTVQIGGLATSNGWGTCLYDDLYVVDSVTPLGERRIQTLYPTSDVAQGFARSTGATNYTLVDDATVNGDTDYVQGSSVGDVDTYGFQDLTGTPATVDAVQVSAFAEKTDATSRSIALQVKSGATTSDGANFALASLTYGKFERLLTTDPNTSAAWTVSGVNALQGGPKVTV